MLYKEIILTFLRKDTAENGVNYVQNATGHFYPEARMFYAHNVHAFTCSLFIRACALVTCSR